MVWRGGVVRQHLGLAPESFHKAPWSDSLVDEYEQLQVQLNFNEKDCLELIEFTPDAQLEVFGKLLPLKKFKKVCEFFKSRGYSFQQLNEHSVRVDDLNIIIGQEDKGIESILMIPPNYPWEQKKQEEQAKVEEYYKKTGLL